MMIPSGYTYTCSAGESFDSIALAVFGNERYAADLLCANPALCRTSVFSGGEKLLIPEKNTTGARGKNAASRAPWKE